MIESKSSRNGNARLQERCAAQRANIAHEVAAHRGAVRCRRSHGRARAQRAAASGVIAGGIVALLTIGRLRGMRLIGRLYLLTTAARRLIQVVRVLPRAGVDNEHNEGDRYEQPAVGGAGGFRLACASVRRHSELRADRRRQLCLRAEESRGSRARAGHAVDRLERHGGGRRLLSRRLEEPAASARCRSRRSTIRRSRAARRRRRRSRCNSHGLNIRASGPNRARSTS